MQTDHASRKLSDPVDRRVLVRKGVGKQAARSPDTWGWNLDSPGGFAKANQESGEGSLGTAEPVRCTHPWGLVACSLEHLFPR